jgi:hypothetical protein
VNKKKQKTLLCWAMGTVSDNAHGPSIKEVFAPLFSKSGRFLSLPMSR